MELSSVYPSRTKNDCWMSQEQPQKYIQRVTTSLMMMTMMTMMMSVTTSQARV